MNHVRTLPVSEAKQRLTVLVKGSEEMFERYLITRNGKNSAVLMSAEEYEGLLETLDILANRKEVRAIAEGTREARSGKTISLERYLARAPKKLHKARTR